MPVPPPPILEVYYSPTCIPCRMELPVLAALDKDGRRLRIVILDQESRARATIGAVSPALERLAIRAATQPPRKALLAAGDTDAILPYARALAGGTCAAWRGGLTMARARALLAACRVSGSRSPRS
ncbi:MAG: thioredoxin family protein [Rhizomicrobium sp.]